MAGCCKGGKGKDFMSKFRDELKRLRHPDYWPLYMEEWLGRKSRRTFYRECPEAGWLLWYFACKTETPGWPNHHEVVLAACDCVETALGMIPTGFGEPRRILEVVREWAEEERAPAAMGNLYCPSIESSAPIPLAALYVVDAVNDVIGLASAVEIAERADCALFLAAETAQAFRWEAIRIDSHSPRSRAEAEEKANKRMLRLIRQRLKLPCTEDL